ncbi:MAG TPA: hypothetical protein VMS08_03775 [Candidatus Saccharimonadia bacterium]|nr:hypothetical protein [Candidatus Saccharimonadia bacterium]
MIMPNSSDGRDIIRAFVTLINARLAREEITGTLVFFRATATTGEDSGTFLADSGWVAQLLAHALGSVSRLALNSEGRRLLPQIRPGCYYITFTRTCVKAGSVVLWGTETAATAV